MILIKIENFKKTNFWGHFCQNKSNQTKKKANIPIKPFNKLYHHNLYLFFWKLLKNKTNLPIMLDSHPFALKNNFCICTEKCRWKQLSSIGYSLSSSLCIFINWILYQMYFGESSKFRALVSFGWGMSRTLIPCRGLTLFSLSHQACSGCCIESHKIRRTVTCRFHRAGDVSEDHPQSF